MSVTVVRYGQITGQRPLLVLGPSLGTSAATLWGACAERLAEDLDVLGWDLPGHGTNADPGSKGLTMADLARDVLEAVDGVLGDDAGRPFHYAGDSVGGAVGLQLLLDAPDRVSSAVLLCTGARIGTSESWEERIAQVRASGTASLVTASAERWFGTGFLEREPARGSALLHALQAADDEGYAAVCGALAAYDVRGRLREVVAPVLAVAGAEDAATPVESLRELADGVLHGRLAVLDGVAHLAPAEAPEQVARLVREQVLGAGQAPAATAEPPAATAEPPAGAEASAATSRDAMTVAQVRAAGMAVRREVLGDAHVDRATASATELTSEFQELITEYAWGTIWTRPGLDRRSRSMVTLTALVARGHHEELAMHVRAALRNGLTREEIKEVLLQTAVYCGVPDANTAFRIADQVLREAR